MDISFEKYLIENDQNKVFDVTYYLYPKRWENVDIDNDLINAVNWSPEIKYLNTNGLDISNEVNKIPNDVGGIYFFFIKGPILPFLENYPAYIGRAKITENQNIRKRCREYYYEFFKKDSRAKISKMIRKWGEFLYFKYIPLTDNDLIEKSEASLINGILPPFNDKIPVIKFENPIAAF